MFRINAIFAAGMVLPSSGLQRKTRTQNVGEKIHRKSTGHGHSDCPCIGITGADGTTNVTIEGTLVSYPSDLGTRCDSWDDERYSALCETGGEPGKGEGWCAQKWCYVDPCNCEGVSPRKSSYALDASYKGKPLYYSYETCGSDDSYTSSLVSHEAKGSHNKGKKDGHKKQGAGGAKSEGSKKNKQEGSSTNEAPGDLTAQADATESKESEDEAVHPKAAETAEASAAKSSSEEASAEQGSDGEAPVKEASSPWSVSKDVPKQKSYNGGDKSNDNQPARTVWSPKDETAKDPSNDGTAQKTSKAHNDKSNKWTPSNSGPAKHESESSKGKQEASTPTKSAKGPWTAQKASEANNGKSAHTQTNDWKPREGVSKEEHSTPWTSSKDEPVPKPKFNDGTNHEATSGDTAESTSWDAPQSAKTTTSDKSMNSGKDSSSPPWVSSNDGSGQTDGAFPASGKKAAGVASDDLASPSAPEDQADGDATEQADGEKGENQQSDKSETPVNGKQKKHKSSTEKASDVAKKAPHKATDAAKKISHKKGEVEKDEEAKAPWEYVKDQILHKIKELEKAVEDAVPLDADKNGNLTTAVQDGKIASGEMAKPDEARAASTMKNAVSQAAKAEEPDEEKPEGEDENDAMEETEAEEKTEETVGDEVETSEEQEDFGAMCSRKVDAKVTGKSGCMCIGIANKQQGLLDVSIGDATVTYPADVGGACSAWEQDAHPDCISDGSNSVPDWCQEAWCYVDPCTCDQKMVRVEKKHSYMPKATSDEKPLFYSYKTCGSVDHWTADNNEAACSNKKSEDDCSGDCVWMGKTCKDQMQMNICGTADVVQSGTKMMSSFSVLLASAVVTMYSVA